MLWFYIHNVQPLPLSFPEHSLPPENSFVITINGLYLFKIVNHYVVSLKHIILYISFISIKNRNPLAPNSPLLPSPGGSPASGQVWTWRSRGPGLLLSPPHPPGGETCSAPRAPPPFPTFQASVGQCFGAESEICEMTGPEISGQLPVRGGGSGECDRVSTLANSGSLSRWRSSRIWQSLPRRCVWFTWGDTLLHVACLHVVSAISPHLPGSAPAPDHPKTQASQPAFSASSVEPQEPWKSPSGPSRWGGRSPLPS